MAIDWQKVLSDPQTQQALIGSALGAGAGGILGASTASPGKRLRSGLLGGLLGAGAGGLGGYALGGAAAPSAQARADAVSAIPGLGSMGDLAAVALSPEPAAGTTLGRTAGGVTGGVLGFGAGDKLRRMLRSKYNLTPHIPDLTTPLKNVPPPDPNGILAAIRSRLTPKFTAGALLPAGHELGPIERAQKKLTEWLWQRHEGTLSGSPELRREWDSRLPPKPPSEPPGWRLGRTRPLTPPAPIGRTLPDDLAAEAVEAAKLARRAAHDARLLQWRRRLLTARALPGLLGGWGGMVTGGVLGDRLDQGDF
jgi:hypothetical protein